MMDMASRSLILFAHGARDVRWASPFLRLQQMIQAKQPDVTVELAFLEFMSPDLPSLVQRLVQDGYQHATIVPVFFGQGGHVLRDLPIMLEQLRKEHPGLKLDIAEAVGESDEVLGAIAQYCIGSLTANRPE
jgi:sirohydrochlorin cobaltochelatase